MIKTAVILAAGKGTRMENATEHFPKTMVPINDTTFIKRMIEQLHECDIQNINVISGYKSNVLEMYIKETFPSTNVTFIVSDKYETTSSAYSLSLMESVNDLDTFVVLESDLYFDKSILHEAVMKSTSSVFTSEQLNPYDNVYVHNKNNRITKINKMDISSEVLVGISVLTKEDFKNFLTYDLSSVDYETVFAEMNLEKHVTSFPWCEVDNAEMHRYCTDQIIPKIFDHNILLNPGPCTTSNEVKKALNQYDICPREQDFGDVMVNVQEKLLKVANTDNHIVSLLTGSGTAIVEATLCSAFNNNGTNMVLVNGAYSTRMTQILDCYGIDYIEYKDSSLTHTNLELLKKELVLKKITHLAMVHNETTTGMQNDLPGISALAKELGITLIVDAMSTFGSNHIGITDIDYLVASSNKSIEAFAGIGYVFIKKDTFERDKNNKVPSLYFNIYKEYQNLKKTGQSRFTPPVQVYYALDKALDILLTETVPVRFNRYKKLSDMLRATLDEVNLKYLVKDDEHSSIITAIELDGMDFDELHDYFQQFRITIYPGKVPGFDTFRIANIGQLRESDFSFFLELFKNYIKEVK